MSMRVIRPSAGVRKHNGVPDSNPNTSGLIRSNNAPYGVSAQATAFRSSSPSAEWLKHACHVLHAVSTRGPDYMDSISLIQDADPTTLIRRKAHPLFPTLRHCSCAKVIKDHRQRSSLGTGRSTHISRLQPPFDTVPLFVIPYQGRNPVIPRTTEFRRPNDARVLFCDASRAAPRRRPPATRADRSSMGTTPGGTGGEGERGWEGRGHRLETGEDEQGTGYKKRGSPEHCSTGTPNI